MDMYEEPTGYGADEQKATEQELYTWFCNWLNGMDFANMSEMQRAQAIWDATKNCEYSIDNSSYKGDYFYDYNDDRGKKFLCFSVLQNKFSCGLL